MQHSDFVGYARDEIHIVFDDDDAAPFADALDQRGGQLAFGLAHAGDGFIEHDQLRFLHQQHANFQPLLLAVAEKRAFDFEIILERNFLGDFVNALDHLCGALEGDAAHDRVTFGYETSRFRTP